MARTPNTQLHAKTLATFVAATYPLPAPITCEFIRRGFNDHYLVRTPAGQHVLRVYLNYKYYIESDADFRFELELLRFLHANGVPVSYPIPGRDGDLLSKLETPAGRRSCALFTFAEVNQAGPLRRQQGRTLGETVARLHLVANRFRSPHRRYHLNLEYLVERPIRLMVQFCHDLGRHEIERYLPRVEQLRQQVRDLPAVHDTYGIIHGDLHPGNFTVTQQGHLTLFDFDHCGYGWRAYDLAVCQGSLSQEAWDACLNAYDSVRPLSAAEVESTAIFRKIRPIWNLGDVLAMRPAWGDAVTFGERFADQIIATLKKTLGD